MRIRRRPLRLDSKRYAMDFGAMRGAGVHVGQVIERIGQQVGWKPVYGEPQTPAEDVRKQGYLMAGFSWEHVVAEHITRVEHATRGRDDLMKPGEQWWCSSCQLVLPSGGPGSLAYDHFEATGHQGIFMTPDGVNLAEWALEEWKWTWRSSSRAVTHGLEESEDGWTDDMTMLTGMPEWIMQSQAYCWALELTRVLFRVMFVNGNYKAMQPEPYTFEIEYTQAELERNWRTIVVNAKHEGMLIA